MVQLLKYFKLKKKIKKSDKGPLSKYLSSETVREANNEVVVAKRSSKHSTYLKATTKQKALIEKYAAENGVVTFSEGFLDDKLNESTMQGWKNS